MTTKLSLKTVSDELQALTDYVCELEKKVEHKVEKDIPVNLRNRIRERDFNKPRQPSSWAIAC